MFYQDLRRSRGVTEPLLGHEWLAPQFSKTNYNWVSNIFSYNMQLLNTYIFDILVFSISAFHPNIIISSLIFRFLKHTTKILWTFKLLLYNVFFNWTRFHWRHKLIFNSKNMVRSCKWPGQDLHELRRALSFIF